MGRLILLVGALLAPAGGATKLLVTVIEQRSGRPLADLKAGDFRVLDDRRARAVEGAEYGRGPIDVMLLVDTSLAGGLVQPVVMNLIEQLQAKEQMALVSFDSSAELIQDFTSSREALRRAVAGVKYGNAPRLLDALFAAMDGGFEHASFRRVALLLTSGVEGPSRESERTVLRLARRSGVSIYPVYALGVERSLLEMLARETGGASFNLRDMKRASTDPPGPRIFEVMRAHYTLTLAGNLAVGEKVRVEVARPGRLLVSALPLD